MLSLLSYMLRCFWWKRKMTCGWELDEEEETTHP